MSSSDARTFSADDALPPVEPPSARFLVQLFVIPMFIVGVIFGIGVGLTWMFSDSSDPRTHLEHIRSDSNKRWYAAVSLAGALADERNAAFLGDRKFMADMAKVLEDDLAAADMGEYPVRFRSYLCRGLGLFHVSAGLPALVAASNAQRDPAEVEVRLSALEALAQLTDNIRQPVAERLLPQSAALAGRLADSVRTAPAGGEVADALVAIAREADDLGQFGKETADLGARSANLAGRLAALVDRAAGIAASAEARDTAAQLRTTAAELAAAAKEAAAVDWQASSPLGKAAMQAADYISDTKRFDEQLRRDTQFDYMIRLRGAFLLGQLGGAEATVRLTELLADPRSVVAYNAAAGLCRHGLATEKLQQTLAEMIASPQVEIEEPSKGFNEATRQRLIEHDRRRIVANGLRGAEMLSKRNPKADLSKVVAAIEKLVDETEQSKLRDDAMTLLEQLKAK